MNLGVCQWDRNCFLEQLVRNYLDQLLSFGFSFIGEFADIFSTHNTIAGAKQLISPVLAIKIIWCLYKFSASY
jgi:hypothetical protein